jgi:hypothetical protein
MPAAVQAVRSLQSLVDDCARVNHTMLQWLTNCLTPWNIERAVQTMESDSRGGPQLATYARYNVPFESGWLKTEVAIDQTSDKLTKIAKWIIRRTWMNSWRLGESPRRNR